MDVLARQDIVGRAISIQGAERGLSEVLHRLLAPAIEAALEERPFPDEPSDVTPKERSNLWMASQVEDNDEHSVFSTGWHALETMKSRSRWLRDTCIVTALGICLASLFAATWTSWALFSMCPGAFLVFLGYQYEQRRQKVKECREQMAELRYWSRGLIEALDKLSRGKMNMPPLLNVLRRAINGEKNPARTRMLKEISPADQVALMRLTTFIEQIKPDRFTATTEVKLSGDAQELIHRTLEFIGVDAARVLYEMETGQAHVVTIP